MLITETLRVRRLLQLSWNVEWKLKEGSKERGKEVKSRAKKNEEREIKYSLATGTCMPFCQDIFLTMKYISLEHDMC
jgi:hypothetical protein